MDELATAFPDHPAIEIAGRQIMLRPVQLRDIPRAIATLRRAEVVYAAGMIDLAHSLEGERGEAFRELLQALSRQPEDWIGNLTLAETMELATALFRANEDFFGLALGLIGRTVPAPGHEPAGPDSSSGSAPPDTV
jgi:hypothetical protein